MSSSESRRQEVTEQVRYAAEDLKLPDPYSGDKLSQNTEDKSDKPGVGGGGWESLNFGRFAGNLVTGFFSSAPLSTIPQAVVYITKTVRCLLHRHGSRHCHLAVKHCTICKRVFSCKYLSCNICFNMLNYVFILNIYHLVNIQQPCHDASHCDWHHRNNTTGFRFL